jgi:hypothetical protein
MILAAFAVEPLPAEQIGLPGHAASNETSGIAPLLDRLGNRLGLDALSRLEARESHIPERASVRVSPWRNRPPHPPIPTDQVRGLKAHGAMGPSLSPLKGGEGLKPPHISLPLPPLVGGEGRGEGGRRSETQSKAERGANHRGRSGYSIRRSWSRRSGCCPTIRRSGSRGGDGGIG